MTFDELLAKHLETKETYVAPVEAEKFRDWMAQHHPDVLADWLHHQEVSLITSEIRRRDSSDRSKARHRAKARAFNTAAVGAEATGDYSGLSTFQVAYVVDDERTRKRVGDMTGADHKYVAGGYQASAKRDQMLAAFHLAIAKKVGGKRTSDVLSEDQYEAMLASITGQAA